MQESKGGKAPSWNQVKQTGDFTNKSYKTTSIRESNIHAAKSIADTVRTSLGPRGMDKMIQNGKGEVLITNDGATILKQMDVIHPTAKMLVEISKAQDIEAGDGTTSVVVIAGSLLNATKVLLERGIHPVTISEGFQVALDEALRILDSIAKPVSMTDRDTLLSCVSTCLSSKVVSSSSNELSPIAVDAVLGIIGDPKTATDCDLRDIRVVKKLGSTIENTSLVEGIVFAKNKPSHSAGGPTKMKDCKIAIIQFCLSSPKTDVENSVIIQEYNAMDRILKEERKYIANLVSKIVKSGANVVLIQKSILRDATNDLSLHFLAKKNIMVVKDIERDEVEFICKTINATPVAHIDQLKPEKLGTAEICAEERLEDDSMIFKMTGVPNQAKTTTILVRGSNCLVIDEAERSIHDALCVMRSLVKKNKLIPGGGAPEIEISLKLTEFAKKQFGVDQMIVKAYADALQIIPYTLAENSGMNPIDIVTSLRNSHHQGKQNAGISVKKGKIIDDITTENVLQPALVTSSALTLSTECVRMILKIDDLVLTAR